MKSGVGTVGDRTGGRGVAEREEEVPSSSSSEDSTHFRFRTVEPLFLGTRAGVSVDPKEIPSSDAAQ
jgi:hypothetical protein